jgi:hypothetical protein
MAICGGAGIGVGWGLDRNGYGVGRWDGLGGREEEEEEEGAMPWVVLGG